MKVKIYGYIIDTTQITAIEPINVSETYAVLNIHLKGSILNAAFYDFEEAIEFRKKLIAVWTNGGEDVNEL